jgi:hypothetical protein
VEDSGLRMRSRQFIMVVVGEGARWLRGDFSLLKTPPFRTHQMWLERIRTMNPSNDQPLLSTRILVISTGFVLLSIVSFICYVVLRLVDMSRR